MKTARFLCCLTICISTLIFAGCFKEDRQAQPPKDPSPTKDPSTGVPLLPALPSEKDLSSKTPSEVVEILTTDQFIKTLEENSLVVVDFNADWCGPCQKLMPYLDRFSNEYKKDGIKFLSVNIDRNSNVAHAYNVGPIPDIRFIVKGKVVQQIIGANLPEIEKEIKNLVAKNTKNAESIQTVSNANNTEPGKNTVPVKKAGSESENNKK